MVVSSKKKKTPTQTSFSEGDVVWVKSADGREKPWTAVINNALEGGDGYTVFYLKDDARDDILDNERRIFNFLDSYRQMQAEATRIGGDPKNWGAAVLEAFLTELRKTSKKMAAEAIFFSGGRFGRKLKAFEDLNDEPAPSEASPPPSPPSPVVVAKPTAKRRRETAAAAAAPAPASPATPAPAASTPVARGRGRPKKTPTTEEPPAKSQRLQPPPEEAAALPVDDDSDEKSSDDDEQGAVEEEEEEEEEEEASFLEKFFSFLEREDKEQEKIMRWSAKGTEVVFADAPRLNSEVCPQHFETDLRTFAKSIESYGFILGPQTRTTAKISHPNFQRGRPDLLKLVKQQEDDSDDDDDDDAHPPVAADITTGEPVAALIV